MTIRDIRKRPPSGPVADGDTIRALAKKGNVLQKSFQIDWFWHLLIRANVIKLLWMEEDFRLESPLRSFLAPRFRDSLSTASHQSNDPSRFSSGVVLSCRCHVSSRLSTLVSLCATD